jgi:ribonuclease HI
VVPGSGRSLVEGVGGQCEALLTGDVGYHDADRAAEQGVALIDLPHGEFEWWAFKRWVGRLAEGLGEWGVTLSLSREWHSPWSQVPVGGCCGEGQRAEQASSGLAGASNTGLRLRIWIDGGSRGNPGLSAIGVVVEDDAGLVLETVSTVIGVATNNVAEYRALLAGLEIAARRGAREVELSSDSELLVRQMLGEYKVKNKGLKPLHAEARERAARFSRFAIRHVDREENARADELVNRALDEHERAGL